MSESRDDFDLDYFMESYEKGWAAEEYDIRMKAQQENMAREHTINAAMHGWPIAGGYLEDASGNRIACHWCGFYIATRAFVGTGILVPTKAPFVCMTCLNG